MPLDWAMAHHNLGGALRTLGGRESGTALLEEAVAACRASLEEHTRGRVPLAWAATQYYLGEALEVVADRRGNPAILEEAIACMINAAEVYRDAGVSYWLPIVESSLERMRAKLGSMTAAAAPGSSDGAAR